MVSGPERQGLGALWARVRRDAERRAVSALGEEGTRVRYWGARGRHLWRRFLGGGRAPVEAPEVDLLLVIPETSRGWILEAVCREIAARWPGSHAFAGDLAALPRARNVWFAHYSFVPEALAHNPHLWGARRVAFFTHLKALPWPREEWIYALDRCHRVVTMNRQDLGRLAQLGVDEIRLRVAIPGVDAERFTPGAERGEAIGFCASYYPRKSPERILELTRALPDRSFILLGSGWSDWDRWEELSSRPNLEILEGDYTDYPAFYRRLRCFVSPGTVEGGPMPLLEALASGVPVAASRTGFAPDLVREGTDGILFEPDAPFPAVLDAVERALALPAPSDPPARDYTWDRFYGVVSEEWTAPFPSPSGSSQ